MSLAARIRYVEKLGCGYWSPSCHEDDPDEHGQPVVRIIAGV
jgi:hypothetical protein